MAYYFATNLIEIDQDTNASRGILLKNQSLRQNLARRIHYISCQGLIRSTTKY